MNKKKVKQRLSEFAGVCQNAENDEKALLEAALFVEDMFGNILLITSALEGGFFFDPETGMYTWESERKEYGQRVWCWR